MKFITLEGLDGSGKSTQLNLLKAFLTAQKIPFKFLHFPRTSTLPFGDLIARFLRGDLGDNQQVDPYLVALLYAEDRNDAKELIKSWISEGYYVVIDRYVHSNIAFQCAKVEPKEEKLKLKEWINSLEYGHFKLPKPDVSIFLDVPFAFTSKNLQNMRGGEDRDYLKGKEDIHEKDLSFQEKVRDVYLNYIDGEDRFSLVNCSKNNMDMLSADEVFEHIKNILREKIFV